MNDSTIYLFGEKRHCDKCRFDTRYDARKRDVIVQYDERRNVLVTRCPNCGYIWMEGCADGTDAIEFPTWTKVEYKKPKSLYDGLIRAGIDSVDAMRYIFDSPFRWKKTKGEHDGYNDSYHPAEQSPTEE